MKFETKKYFIIYNEESKKYWDRINKKFRPIEFATEYEGNSESQIQLIIENEPNLKRGHYSVKQIIRKTKIDS